MDAAFVGAGIQAARLRRLLRRADCAVHLRGRQRLAVFGRGLAEPGLLHRCNPAFELDAALIVEGERRSIGTPWEQLLDIAQAAEMLVNISGHLTCEALKPRFRTPCIHRSRSGYTQFWMPQASPNTGYAITIATSASARTLASRSVASHTRASHGAHTPARGARGLADGGVHAAPTRFTTIASWRGPLGRVTHGRRRSAPRRTNSGSSSRFRRAATPRSKSRWRRIWPIVATSTRCASIAGVSSSRNAWCRIRSCFARYVQHSSAEFSVAQGIYVRRNPAGSATAPFAISRRASRRWCRIRAGRDAIQAARDCWASGR